MKLLIINNHDSFTFNLVDLIRKLNVPYDVLNVEDLKKSTVEKCVNAVLDFLTLYLNERKGKVKL